MNETLKSIRHIVSCTIKKKKSYQVTDSDTNFKHIPISDKTDTKKDVS